MPDRWKIGDAVVTAVVEEQTEGVPAGLFFPDATADDVRDCTWLDGGYASPDGSVSVRVQAFLVVMPGTTVLVDPCVGNGKKRMLPFWNELDHPWLERLAGAGATPADVDLVVHTHLHADHVGWDTHLADGEWRPTFTNARHVYVGDELDYWRSTEQRTLEDVYADSVAPVIDAGLADIVGADGELAPGLRLFSTPGHTPGHASLAIESAGEQFVVCGDLIHHPVQAARPEWAEIGDWDAARARETRRAFLDESGGRGMLVAGAHFPTNPVGRFVPDGARWRFAPEGG